MTHKWEDDEYDKKTGAKMEGFSDCIKVDHYQNVIFRAYNRRMQRKIKKNSDKDYFSKNPNIRN